MNILIRSFDGKTRVRPDSTLNRFKEDLYLCDDVNLLLFTPVVFSHICRAGKAVPEKFAGRYYSNVGSGLLLMPDGDEFYDFTSLLSMVPFTREEASKEKNNLIVHCSGKKICDICIRNCIELLQKGIAECSAHTSLKTGDFLAVELSEPAVLRKREEGDAALEASLGDRMLFETKLIF